MIKNNLISSIKSPSIFIVSSGRSGTTLLISILNASQQIQIPYESDFIARAYPFYQERKKLDRDDYENLVRMFFQASQPRGWGLKKEYLLSYLEQIKPQTFSAVNSAICAAYHEREGTQNLLWGIKAPVLIASIDRILSVYPDAKILHIVRDGRDVCLSYQNVHAKSEVKFGPKGLVANALYWIDGLRRIEACSTKQIHEFRYEDLLANPQAELKKICDFLGIVYLDSMYQNYYNLEKNKKFASDNLMSNIHSKIKGGLDSKNTYKYLMKMSKFKRFIFELVAVPYLKKYNYRCEFPLADIFLLNPLRNGIYFAARQINNWRYSKRDLGFAEALRDRIFYSK